MDTFTALFPAYAGLSDDQLLELAEETAIALAESARGAHDAGCVRVAAVAARLGLADEIEPLGAYLAATTERTR
jgi:hypothetical protein